MTKAVFFGLSGPAITSEEQAFFEAASPAGFILFARNIHSQEQIRDLTASLQALAPDDRPAPILIDQEGGRVRRLRPPLALEHPPGRPFGQLYERDRAAACEAARLHGAAIGAELLALGITVDCLPVLDLLFEEAHDIIGDRALSRDPAVVAALGEAVMAGLGQSGIVPVIKHIPGHGRARADSHLELPIVDAPAQALSSDDFKPFIALSSAPMAMTAHILYTALDAQHCATHSAFIVGDIIRKHIGFDGVLMTDDLSMKALGGDMETRTRLAIAAGCDIILHCNGDMAEMSAIADVAPRLAGRSLKRLEHAMSWPQKVGTPIDVAACVAERDSLLSSVA